MSHANRLDASTRKRDATPGQPSSKTLPITPTLQRGMPFPCATGDTVRPQLGADASIRLREPSFTCTIHGESSRIATHRRGNSHTPKVTRDASRGIIAYFASPAFAAAEPSFPLDRSAHATTETTSANVGRPMGAHGGVAPQGAEGNPQALSLRPVRRAVHRAHADGLRAGARLPEPLSSLLAGRRGEDQGHVPPGVGATLSPATRAKDIRQPLLRSFLSGEIRIVSGISLPACGHAMARPGGREPHSRSAHAPSHGSSAPSTPIGASPINDVTTRPLGAKDRHELRIHHV